MAVNRVVALRSLQADLIGLARDFTDADWATESRCPGWSVKGVVSHMSAAVHGTFTPWVVKMMSTKDIERNNDADVEARQAWAPAKVLREYEVWSKRFCRAATPLQHPPLSALPIRVGEVGTYPAKMLASALVFDTYLHTHYDIATALGKSVPPPDPAVLEVTVEWMLAGLPTMTGEALSWLTRPVDLVLQGDGGGTWHLAPGNGKLTTVAPGSSPDAAARIVSSAESFTLWATHRSEWRDAQIDLKDDEPLAERVLDSIRVI